MVTTISQSRRKARKAHNCSAWEFIDADFYEDEGYKCAGINKGNIYEYQFNSGCGNVWEFKACLPCLEYASKNDIDLSGE